MSVRIFVKPRRGLVVRHPSTGAVLPETGRDIEIDGYWRRRLIAGDVFADPPARARKSKKTRTTPTEDDS